MIKNIIFSSLIIFSPTGILFSQTIEFQKYIQEEYELKSEDLIYTNDENYLISGSAINFDDEGNRLVNFHTTKLDKNGIIINTNAYGDSLENFLRSSCQLRNGNIAFAGYSSLGGLNTKSTILMTNNLGDSLWMKNYGQGTNNSPTKMIVTNDDHLIVSEDSRNGNGIRLASLSKLDFEGNLIWKKNIGDSLSGNVPLDVIELDSGDFMISGWWKNSNSHGYLIKVNSNGDILWDRKISINGQEAFIDLQISNDGNILIGGFTGDLDHLWRRPLLIKMDVQGNIIWQKEYIDESYKYTWGSKIIEDESSNIFLLGTNGDSYSINLWFMKINELGDEVYRTLIGDESSNWAAALTQLEDDAFGLFSNSKQMNSTTGDSIQVFYLTKIKDTLVSNSTVLTANTELSASPNPCSQYVEISFFKSEYIDNLSIYNIKGELMYEDHSFSAKTKTINVSDFQNGMYNVIATTRKHGTISKKIIVKN